MMASVASVESYWWKLASTDCRVGNVNLKPQPACAIVNASTAALEACCLVTKGCGGFNNNGEIKNTNCYKDRKTYKGNTLYILSDQPHPPPPPPPPPPAAPSNLPWPYPNDAAFKPTGSANVTLATAFAIKVSSSCATLDAAIARYTELATKGHAVDAVPSASGELTALQLDVKDLDESHPQLGHDESYTLSVPAEGGAATLAASTVWGALHGLETFSQLVLFDFASERFTIPGAPWAIDDKPRFPHRGLMIDTARHFETLSAIRGIVDSLPYAKLNVLHWHMSDMQSFPFQSLTHPKLWDGAYSAQERYTQTDIAAVVEYARLRGVRVMVEFDMPGHAASWCKGYPEVCPSASCLTPLNVAHNATFDLVGALLGECTGGAASAKGKPMGLFPDNMIHLGGDEVDVTCWNQTAEIAKWLSDRGMSADDGYAYFVKATAAFAIAQGRQPVQWSEVYDHFKTKLPKDVIVHVWKRNTNVTELVSNGYRTIVNVGYNSKSWYLDNLNVKWDAVYSNEPCHGVPDDLCDKFVLGGHGEMWGERVDASDLEQTVWPRLAAIAERLWSPRTMTDTNAALARIENFRCLLNRRGVRAAPVRNADAREAPPGAGSCFGQR
jgi:hexosaminidase